MDKTICAVCRGPVILDVLSDAREMEYGLDWRGRLMACASCGLIQQAPMPTMREALAAYPECYAHYDSGGRGIRAWLMRRYMDRTLRRMKRLDPTGTRKKLLDVGCGGGEKTAILRDALGLNVFGVEPNPAAAERARRTHELNVYAGGVEDLPSGCGPYDWIRINHVLEHVPDPVGFLDQLYPLLAPGGVLIGETENIGCPSYRVFGRYWALLHLPYHLVLFDNRTLTVAFGRSRFGHVHMRNLADPTVWSLSLQNYLRRNQPILERTSARMPGYLALTLCALPAAWMENASRKGPVIEFWIKTESDKKNR